MQTHFQVQEVRVPVFGVVLAVLELVTDCMDECFDLMCENALYAWLVRKTWLLQVKQWRDLLISPKRASLA